MEEESFHRQAAHRNSARESGGCQRSSHRRRGANVPEGNYGGFGL